MAKEKKKKGKDNTGDFTEDVPKVKAVRSAKEIVNFVREERFKVVLGSALIFLAVFLSIAFVSYLLTWKFDQNKLSIPFGDFIKNPQIIVENWAGKIGAYLSHIFIHRGFGLASFSLALILLVTGIRLFKVRLLPLRKTIFYSLILTYWLSLTLSFFYGSDYFYLGGTHGYFMVIWLNAFWGKIGTLLFLGLVIFTFIIFAIKNSLAWFKEIVKKRESTEFNDDDAKIETNDSDTIEENLDPIEDVNLDENTETETDAEIVSETEAEAISEAESESEKKAEEEFLIKEKKTEEKKFDEIPWTIEPRKEEELVVNESISESKNAEKIVEKKIDETIIFGVKRKPKIEEGVENSDTTENNLPPEINDGVDFTVEKHEDELITDEPDGEKEIRIEDLGPYDPTLDLSRYQLPPLDLLVDYKSDSEVTPEELNSNKNKIVETLKNYNIEILSIKATIGPTITLYEIIPAPGIRISKIKNLEDDIALSLSALGIRIIAPMPGKGTIGIEVPNLKPEVVSMWSIIASTKFQESKFDLPVALGKTISNETFTFDLAKMPHLLVAGATGQGKSVGLNAILASLLYKKHPAQLKFVLVDPKKVELTLYSKIEKHFLAKIPDAEEAIICDTHKVVNTLNSLCKEMDSRYDLLKMAAARTIKEYNTKFSERKLNPEKGHKYLPYIVVVIDEFADLIMTAGKEVEMPIARIAQLARAVGIHMIIATQRPSTNIITGTIKANFPARIAFKVASMIDSRTILDCPGANQLVGKGDLLMSQGSELIRIQCAFVDTPEIEKICDYIASQQGYPSAFELPEYVPESAEGNMEITDTGKRDEMFAEAARLVVIHQQGSTSLIQRKFAIGYNRAGRLMDQLEKAGIVGSFEGSKARKVMFSDLESLESFLRDSNII
ncbi:MAG TPA: cell division protein FtsK [Bacteroidales bacterium]|nr:cell division protein FtsK [Bacteroidales bacterium]